MFVGMMDASPIWWKVRVEDEPFYYYGQIMNLDHKKSLAILVYYKKISLTNDVLEDYSLEEPLRHYVAINYEKVKFIEVIKK